MSALDIVGAMQGLLHQDRHLKLDTTIGEQRVAAATDRRLVADWSGF